MTTIQNSTYQFLTQLKTHNNRDWFTENKSSYQIAHTNLAEFMDELTFPEKHDVFLIFHCLFDLSSQKVTSLLFLDLVDITEGSTSELLDDLVSLV